jgi:N-methylhydantoinase A
MHYVGIDTGGTFTDVTYVGPDGSIATLKTPTTGDLRTGIRRGVEQLTDRVGVAVGDLDHLAHGSTVAVNTLIERTGAETALVTTAGFRDRLEVGELYRPSELLYDPTTPATPPLVPRRHRFEVEERLAPDGSVITPLTEDTIDEVVAAVAAAPVEAVAVCTLFAYRNDEHERRLADALAERTDCTVTRASALSAEIGEYERMATAVADAYVKPRVSRYMRELGADLATLGLGVPLHIMKSDGGLARSGLVAERPISQLISGPIAGVIAAQYFGAQAGIENQITFDMGGTSCDTSLIVGGEPTEDATRKVGDLRIKGPFTTVETIGAGGGSIAWLDDAGALHVGPQSAGAEPGPACYGRGGEEPTVTDANLVLGLINPAFFAGGSMPLDAEAAHRSLERIADPLGMSVVEAALAVREVVNANMAGATRVVSVEQGFDPREFTLTAFGGAGALHAVDVADAMGITSVLVPNHPGLTSSLGMLLADVRHNFVQSVLGTTDGTSAGAVEATFRDLEAEATVTLDAEQVPEAERTLVRTVDARYVGQAHYLNLPVGQPVEAADLDSLAGAFEDEHRRVYGFVDQNAAVELVNARVTAVGHIDTPDLAVTGGTREGSLADAARGTETVVLPGNREAEATHYRWPDVVPGDELVGPAVIEQRNSTIWIPPDHRAAVNDYKNLIITETDR